MLDAHLDLLDTDIPSKYFVCLHNVLKTSSRYVFKTFSRRLQDMSSRCLQDVLHVIIFRLPRCLQIVFARRLQDNFKTSSRRLGRRKIVTLKMCWRCLQDISSRRLQRDNFLSYKTSSRCLGRRNILMLKTCWRRLQDQQMLAGKALLLCCFQHFFAKKSTFFGKSSIFTQSNSLRDVLEIFSSFFSFCKIKGYY